MHAEELAAVEALLAVTKILNPAIAEHLHATAALAKRIAEQLGLPGDAVTRTYLAAHVHDVGLNGVDVRILDKAAALTEHEYNICRLHAERSALVLQNIPCLAEIAPIVRSHHERVDGLGYPDGLCGADISLESRIVAVADAFHAMATNQSWRDALSPFAAIQELVRAAGTHFDPDVVNALIAELGHGHRRSMIA